MGCFQRSIEHTDTRINKNLPFRICVSEKGDKNYVDGGTNSPIPGAKYVKIKKHIAMIITSALRNSVHESVLQDKANRYTAAKASHTLRKKVVISSGIQVRPRIPE